MTTRQPSRGRYTPYGPILIYPLVVLAFAVAALIGWPVTRRFGGRRQAFFLVAIMIVGPLRWAAGPAAGDRLAQRRSKPAPA